MPRLILLLALVLVAVSGAAARAAPLDPPAGDSAAAYREALRWSAVRPDIRYLDPADPFELLPDQTERPEPAPPPEPLSIRTPVWLRVVLIGLFLAFLWLVARRGLVRLGGAPGDVALSGGPGDAASRRTAPKALPQIDRIRANPDRRAAIIELLQLVLARAAARTGIVLHPSWTARDAVARLPADWPGRAALTDLTRTAEEAHFGDYPVSEERFAHHLNAAANILAEPAR